MEKMEKKNLNTPEERRNFPKGHVDLVTVGDVTFGKGTMEPGWKWEDSVKPIVKTDSCQQNHTVYVIQGTMHIQMDDGKEMDFSQGDCAIIPPGHKAWVVGNEPCITIDFTGYTNYALQPEHEHAHETH